MSPKAFRGDCWSPRLIKLTDRSEYFDCFELIESYFKGINRHLEPLFMLRLCPVSVATVEKLLIQLSQFLHNRPFSYSTKEPGSGDIFIHFYTRSSIEWR